jgi:hypothetical protein
MLGMLIFMVDSSPGWDDTGVSAAMVLVASGLMGAIHPARAWVWALAVGLWVPLMGFASDPAGFHSASVFATVGAYVGALVGRYLAESDPARQREHTLFTEVPRKGVLGSPPLVFPDPRYTDGVALGREPVARRLYLLHEVRQDERHRPYLRLLGSPKALLPRSELLATESCASAAAIQTKQFSVMLNHRRRHQSQGEPTCQELSPRRWASKKEPVRFS